MKPLEVLNRYKPHTGSLSSLLESRAQKQDLAPFLIFHDPKEKISRAHTWSSFKSWVVALSEFLASEIEKKKISHKENVVVVSQNSDLMVALFFALSDQNLVFVPMNPDFGVSEAAYVLKHSDTKLIFATPDQKEKLTQALGDNPNHTKIVELHEDLITLRSSKKLFHKGSAEDINLILYTSGTTGFPKGVMHSQETCVMAGEAFVERMHLIPEDRLFCILPFFHINALFYSLMGSVAAGASLIVCPKFSASQFWNIAADLKATEVNIIAAVGTILSQRHKSEWRKDHVIKKIYGAPITAEIEKIFREEFNVPLLLEGYGMTEIPGAINNQIDGPFKIGSMGVAALHPNRNLKFTELKIIDENELPVSEGEYGELVVKTPLLMKGYYKEADQTKESFTSDGWFKTGDYIKQDKDGFFIFVARKKDIIRKRGENISGAELDRIAGQCPGVLEAAAIGTPSPLGEEDILLAIVKKADSSLTERDIHLWCSEKLSKIKIPRYIVFLDSLPHTPTARVAKFKLKAMPDLLIKAVDFES